MSTILCVCRPKRMRKGKDPSKKDPYRQKFGGNHFREERRKGGLAERLFAMRSMIGSKFASARAALFEDAERNKQVAEATKGMME